MTGDTMKTIVAMLVSGTILFPGLSQAQTLEQSVARHWLPSENQGSF